MKMLISDKVDQTLFGIGVGNCWPACLATITGIPLDQIPNFCVRYQDTEWYLETIRWLRPQGFALWNTVVKGDPLDWVEALVPDVPWIAGGRNVMGQPHFCVFVGRKLWHDPNPHSRQALSDGLVEVEDATFFLRTRYR